MLLSAGPESEDKGDTDSLSNKAQAYHHRKLRTVKAGPVLSYRHSVVMLPDKLLRRETFPLPEGFVFCLDSRQPFHEAIYRTFEPEESLENT